MTKKQELLYSGNYHNLIFYYEMQKRKYHKSILLYQPTYDELMTDSIDDTHIFAYLTKEIYVQNSNITILLENGKSGIFLDNKTMISMFQKEYQIEISPQNHELLLKSRLLYSDLWTLYFGGNLSIKKSDYIPNTMEDLYYLKYNIEFSKNNKIIITKLDEIELYFKETGLSNMIFYLLTILHGYQLNCKKWYNFLSAK